MREVFCGRGVAAKTKEGLAFCGTDSASRCYFGTFGGQFSVRLFYSLKQHRVFQEV